MAGQQAVDRVQERRYHERLAWAVRDLLVDHGFVTEAELERAEQLLLQRSPALGARVVARAWVDPGFRERLVDDARSACGELGIELGPIEIGVIECTPRLHHLVVCTLCSCYPRALLGVPPDWYKDAPYRSRAVREPRQVLAELGTQVPEDVEVRVHDSTADLRYLVLPLRPENTEELDELDLARLVTRDSMIGVEILSSPA